MIGCRKSLFWAGCFLTLTQVFALAQTVIDWQGGNGNWAAASNWIGNQVPDSSGEVARFDSSTLNTVINQNVSNLTVAQLIYTSNAISRTITGNTINLAGYNGVSLVDNATTTQTIATALTATGYQTWQINSGVLNVTGSVSQSWGSLTKTGDGMLILSGCNSGSTPVIVNGGVLRLANSNALGSSNWGNVIANGAALELTNSITVTEGGLAIAGDGVNETGVIHNVGGNNTIAATINLSASSLISAESGTALTLRGTLNGNSNDLTVTGSGALVISGTINSMPTMTYSGTGTLTLSGSGKMSIDTTVINSGTVVLAHTSTNELGGNVIINSSGLLQLGASEQIANDKSVTVNGTGVFNLNNYSETIDTLDMNAGTINTGTGTLTVQDAGGKVVNVYGDGTTSTINGQFAFSGYMPTANVEGTATLNVNATLSASNGFYKTGTGTLQLDKAVTTGGSSYWQNRIDIQQGTVLLGASNVIADSTPIALSGGTLATGGHSDVMGSLTLNSNSTIDMGNGCSIIEFSSGTASSGTLTITNWSGKTTGGGTDQILFDSSPNSAFLSSVYWADYGAYGAKVIYNGSTYEIVPLSMPVVPEAGTVAAGILLSGLVILREWWGKRKKQTKHSKPKPDQDDSEWSMFD